MSSNIFTSRMFQRNPSEFRTNIHRELRIATFELQDRGLKQSAAWASDLLQTISSDSVPTQVYNENAPDPSMTRNNNTTSTPSGTRSSSRLRQQPPDANANDNNMNAQASSLNNNKPSSMLQQQQPKSDSYLLAKSYFDLAEYKRSAYALKHIQTPFGKRLTSAIGVTCFCISDRISASSLSANSRSRSVLLALEY